MNKKNEKVSLYPSYLFSYIENFAFQNIWLIISINILGTIFGFWYYIPQLSNSSILMWPVIPDSPVATLFMALSLLFWKLNHNNETINMLAFFGCIKLGFWTPYILIVFKSNFDYLSPIMYQFLLWSHLSMAAEALIIRNYSNFNLKPVIFSSVWYLFNDLTDYLFPIIGKPHHTYIPSEISHSSSIHQTAATVAFFLSILIIFLAFSIYVNKIESKK